MLIMIITVMTNVYWVLSTFTIHFGIISSELSYYWTVDSNLHVFSCSTQTLECLALNKFSINDAWSNVVGKAEIVTEIL